ncbi:MAG TPA: ATP-binding cassette domain-containing protein, partial [Polyangiaceae bacterium]|nr:ATP-binding cassette domain-containing protein [Polyangiaceae bacterium]
MPIAHGLVCPRCARSFPPPGPAMFSYQSPVGACPSCRGFGRTIGIDYSKVIPNEDLSIEKGAIRAWTGKTSQYERRVLVKWCKAQGIPMDVPWRELTKTQQKQVIEGEGKWAGGRYPGVRAWFEWLETRTYKMHVRVLLSRYRSYDLCRACNGKRLSPASLAYQVQGKDLGDWHALEIKDAVARLESLEPLTGQGRIAKNELVSRLGYLKEVGLGYLTLDRQARTLSGGEAQRVSLTAALGTALTGVLFVLDEPTVGLHPSDVPPLVASMRELAARGNVVLVVEHDPLVIAACDRVIELGPGAGAKGGKITFDGAVASAAKKSELATARALAPVVLSRRERRKPGPERLVVKGARGHNLRDVNVDLPLACIVAVTGPSGSGKSSLAHDLVYRTVARKLGKKDVEAPIEHDRLDGIALLRDVVLVDQAPLGRTSRGNPATYTGAWNRIRALFADEPLAQERGLGAGHFSLNVAGGRCEACSGEGSETVEMQFLADVSLTCPTCSGRRFKPEVLEVRHRERTVSDVLAMTIEEARAFFDRDPAILRALAPLSMLGLGYLTLGQPLPTLSGGEAQRLKLARALAEPKQRRLFVLDEPSAGLHADEVVRVCAALDALVQGGASVLVVEHDLAIVSHADWVIELGPAAGKDGGLVVAEGTPEQIAKLTTKTGVALSRASRAPDLARRPLAHAADLAVDGIQIEHAREHNLKDVSLTLPHGKVIVVTGPSGSGKSTLAFDVVFAEGQRRFLETLTPYARQFLPTLPRPDVDRVVGVPPAIALEQRTTRSGSNSTVATVTEIAHYLRLLFAKVGDAYCPKCDVPIAASTPEQAFRRVRSEPGEVELLAPAVVSRKGTYLDVFTGALRAGIAESYADGVLVSNDAPPRLKKTAEHSIDLVVARGPAAAIERALVDRALSWGKGSLKLRRIVRGKAAAAAHDVLVSTERVCPSCGDGVPELDPRFFSFATKQGQCPACEGSGRADPDALPGEGEPCDACGGARLAPLPRAQRLGGLRYHEATSKSIGSALAWASGLAFDGTRAVIAEAPQR